MAYLRFMIDFAIPEDPNGTLVGGLKIPTILADKIPVIRQAILNLKGYAENINEGLPNEEETTKAKWHICRHDQTDPPPCVEVDI